MKKLLIISWLVAFVAPAAFPATHDYDLVVYGGTAGGVATAVAGAREGLATVLLEPRDHVGGMVTGGLSWSDTGKEEVIGGIALEFAWPVGNKYQARYYRAHQSAVVRHPHKTGKNYLSPDYPKG